MNLNPMKLNLPAVALGGCLGMIGVAPSADADVLVSYNFDNTSDFSEIEQENVVGTPTLTLVEDGDNNQVEAAFGTANAAPDWAAAWQSTASGGSYWQIDLNTTSYEDLSLEFFNRSSGAGATSVTIAWAVGGGAFTDVETVTLNRASAFTEYDVDLSSVAAIEGQADVQIRATWGTDGTAPNTRLDDVTLSGTLVPEPGSMALLAAGVFMLGWRRAKA